MLPAQRVATRFVLADSIGDPRKLLEDFKHQLVKFEVLEPKADRLIDHLKRMAEARGTGPEIQDQAAFHQLDGAWASTIYSDVSSVAVGTEYIFRQLRGFGQPLFWAILQQLSLPPPLLKKVQAATKYWSKSDLKFPKAKEKWMPRNGEKVLAYKKLLNEFHSQIDTAELALAKGKAHSEEGSTTKRPAGPFTVINTGGFSDEIVEKAIKSVEVSAKMMQGIGLSKVCYGDVLISNTLTSRTSVAAFYVINSDEMFVRANVSPDHDTVRFICHELAHRWEHKFGSGKRNAIVQLYATLNTKAMFETDYKDFPSIGKTFQYEGRELVVKDVDFRRKTVKFHDQNDPPNMLSIAPIKYWKAKIEGVPLPAKDIEFVTEYAKKGGPSENFAEMVSFYAVGKLGPKMVEMLLPILS